MDDDFMAFEAQVAEKKRKRKAEKKKKKKAKRKAKKDKKKAKRGDTVKPAAHEEGDVAALAHFENAEDAPVVVDMSLDLSRPLEPLTYETLTVPDAAAAAPSAPVAAPSTSWRSSTAAASTPANEPPSESPAAATTANFQDTLNRLMAQATKAQLMNDREEYERVAKTIEALHRDKTAGPAQVVYVPDVDKSGSVVVLPRSMRNAEEGSIAAMVAEEKGLRGASKSRAKLKDVLKGGVGEEDEYGELVGGSSGTLDFSTGRGQSKNKKQKVTVIDNTRKPQASLRAMAMQEQILARCSLCNRRKELLIATARHSYLMLPARQGLHPFHCYIVPLQHVPSFASAEVDLLQELDLWKRSLVRMLRACKSRATPSFECVFIETVVRLDRLPHTLIECIPVPVQNAGDISLFFHKSISEEGELWSTNPKVTDTKDKRLHQCIPKDGFPYIHVEWDRQRESKDAKTNKESTAAVARGGIAHVIEDDKRFKRNFGREVVGGILGLDRMQINGGTDDPKAAAKRVAQFRQFFSPGYDFTQFITD